MSGVWLLVASVVSACLYLREVAWIQAGDAIDRIDRAIVFGTLTIALLTAAVIVGVPS